MEKLASMFSGVSYFHGSLSPDQANFRLNRRGCQDGLFLIYEDIEFEGRYILAICSGDRIRTYYLGISPNGTITYGDGVTAPLMHPNELIHYHLLKCKAFPVRPLVPCIRPNENDDVPMAWSDVTMNELETRMLHVAPNETKPADVLLSERRLFLISVAKRLHTSQPWFHGSLSRQEAEERLGKTGHGPGGKFLIREKDEGSFVLSMCYKQEFRHYTINRKDTESGEMYYLDDEPMFYNIMDVVAHYTCKPKSFVLTLSKPCAVPNYKKPAIPEIRTEATEALNNYVSEMEHLQKFDKATGVKKTLPKPNYTQTDQVLSVATSDQIPGSSVTHTIKNPKISTGKEEGGGRNQELAWNRNELQESVQDDDDRILEKFISTVTSFNDDFLVTKIEVQDLRVNN